MLAELFDAAVDIGSVELDRRVHMTDLRHPVAQYLFGPVGVVVCANVENDRRFRIIERLYAIEVERQRRLFLLGEDRQ